MTRSTAFAITLCLVSITQATAQGLMLAVDGTGQQEVESLLRGADEPAIFPAESSAEPALWTSAQVRDWSAANAEGARVFEAERRAVAAAYDRDSKEQCQQAALIRMVLAELAEHDRNRAAADGLSAYYRIIVIEQQVLTLRQAIEVLETLIGLAKSAEQFELPDGNPSELERQRLGLAIKVVDAEYGLRKLRLQLARLTGQPLKVTNHAVLIDTLPLDPLTLTVDQAVAEALAHRADLRAIEVVCPRITEETLAAVRSLMGLLQPGLGLGSAVACKKSLFCLRSEEGGDVCARREQCRALAEMRRGQIADEVRLAETEWTACQRRTELVTQQLQLAQQEAKESIKAVELEQSPPGADLLAALKSLQIRGELQTRQMEQAIANVEFFEVLAAARR